jgi:antitoxin VapB
VSLNIKNEETHRLVRRLAELTGQSQTSAVEDAVRRRLEELERTEGRSARREAMLRIARESAALIDPDLSNDPNEVLYDDLGMPK